MSKHTVIHINNVPEKECPIRESYEHLKTKLGHAPEYWDFRECCYCVNFRGVESLYPHERTLFVHCFEIPAGEWAEPWDGGRIKLEVQ